MITPLVISKAGYQDLVVMENSYDFLQIDFTESDGTVLDITDYNFRLACFTQSKQTVPDIIFTSSAGDFVQVATGSILWTIYGSKTSGKEGSYTYFADLIHKVTGNENSFLYGMFTVINKNI
jgi:hypothetical protein